MTFYGSSNFSISEPSSYDPQSTSYARSSVSSDDGHGYIEEEGGYYDDGIGICDPRFPYNPSAQTQHTQSVISPTFTPISSTQNSSSPPTTSRFSKMSYVQSSLPASPQSGWQTPPAPTPFRSPSLLSRDSSQSFQSGVTGFDAIVNTDGYLPIGDKTDLQIEEENRYFYGTIPEPTDMVDRLSLYTGEERSIPPSASSSKLSVRSFNTLKSDLKSRWKGFKSRRDSGVGSMSGSETVEDDLCGNETSGRFTEFTSRLTGRLKSAASDRTSKSGMRFGKRLW